MVHKGYINLIVSTAILIGCIFISGCLDQTSENGNNGGDQEAIFITYENTQSGISIKYLDTWVKLENPSSDILVTFMPDEDDVLQGIFNISIFGDGFLDMELFKETHIENLSRVLTDFDIIYEDIIELAGRESYTVLFTFRDGENTFERQEIWTVDSDPHYLLTYQVDQTYYADYSDTVEQMVDSFEIVSTNGDSDFNRFVGAWTKEESVAVTFFSNGNFTANDSFFLDSSGTFEMYFGKLLFNFSDMGVKGRYDYSFSDNDHILTLTEVSITGNRSIVLIKQQ